VESSTRTGEPGRSDNVTAVSAVAEEDEMKALTLAILVVSLGLTSGCFVFKTKEVQTGQPLTQADCERAGGKWKTGPDRCDL
jgi:hypothetical protein